MPVPPSDTPGLVIAGVIGAGASIVTQVIASVVAGKREKRRFAWERDTQDREWQKQERDRFLDLEARAVLNRPGESGGAQVTGGGQATHAFVRT